MAMDLITAALGCVWCYQRERQHRSSACKVHLCEASVNPFSTVNLLLLQVFHLLHGHNLDGAVEVVPGEQHTGLLT